MKDGISKDQGPAQFYQEPDRTNQSGTAIVDKNPGEPVLEVERVFLQEEVSGLLSKVRRAERQRAAEHTEDIARAAYERGLRAAAVTGQQIQGASEGGDNNV